MGRYFLPFVMNLAVIHPSTSTTAAAPARHSGGLRGLFMSSPAAARGAPPPPPPARTLLVGCDSGDFAFHLFKHGADAATQIVTVDVSAVRGVAG